MKTVTIAITGMSCQGCADTLARVLRTVPGVQTATVSYPDKRAVIGFDARTVKTDTLVTAVERAGFTAELP
jgi:copper chaperone CopZ